MSIHTVLRFAVFFSSFALVIRVENISPATLRGRRRTGVYSPPPPHSSTVGTRCSPPTHTFLPVGFARTHLDSCDELPSATKNGEITRLRGPKTVIGHGGKAIIGGRRCTAHREWQRRLSHYESRRLPSSYIQMGGGRKTWLLL